MRALIMVASLLSILAMPALAQDDDDDENNIPEPGIVSLVGIGAAAYLIARRRKK
jgi:PEP-CTERM motif